MGTRQTPLNLAHYAAAKWSVMGLASGFRLGLAEQGHGAFGQVAAFADLSFIVGFDQHRSGQPQERFGVWGRRRRRWCGAWH
jgi:hypothetical protein